MKKVASGLLICGVVLPAISIIAGIAAASKADSFAVFCYYLIAALLTCLVLVGEGLALQAAAENNDLLKELSVKFERMEAARKKADAVAPVPKTEATVPQAEMPKSQSEGEAQERQTAIPVIDGNKIVCPLCGTRQPGNREVCYECGCRFIRP